MRPRRAPRSSGSPLLGWIGWAGLDAIGRLALLTGSTVILARMLDPRDFGVAALALVIVSVAGVFVGAPFEDALAQRRVLRASHIRVALAASWIIAAVALIAAIAAAPTLARLYGAPDMTLLLPVAVASVFFSGHSDVMMAAARRLKRFNDIAIASLIGHVIGVALAVALAFAGGGVWALIAQRLLVLVVRAIALQCRIGFLIWPRWSSARLAELIGYARVSFATRLAENLTYLAFTNLVQAFYGTLALGYVSMAMRMIEPLRGAIVATSHNLAFGALARSSEGREKALASEVASQTALLTAPIFAGLAAVATPALLLIAGPGWGDAGPVAAWLCLGAALAVPAGMIFTTISARGRPEINLYSQILSFLVTVIVMKLTIPLGPLGVGVARAAGDGARAAMGLLTYSGGLGWSPADRLRAMAPAWLLSGVMAAGVSALGLQMTDWPLIGKVATLVGFGICLYAVLVALFARKALRGMHSRILGRPD